MSYDFKLLVHNKSFSVAGGSPDCRGEAIKQERHGFLLEELDLFENGYLMRF